MEYIDRSFFLDDDTREAFFGKLERHHTVTLSRKQYVQNGWENIRDFLLSNEHDGYFSWRETLRYQPNGHGDKVDFYFSNVSAATLFKLKFFT